VRILRPKNPTTVITSLCIGERSFSAPRITTHLWLMREELIAVDGIVAASRRAAMPRHRSSKRTVLHRKRRKAGPGEHRRRRRDRSNVKGETRRKLYDFLTDSDE
jgi:hypothetical protein